MSGSIEPLSGENPPPQVEAEIAEVAAASSARLAAKTETVELGRPRLALRVDLAAVEGLALLVVAEDFVGGPDFGEALLGFRFLALVGMVLLGELAKRGFDFRPARSLRNAKNVIGITHYRPVFRPRLFEKRKGQCLRSPFGPSRRGAQVRRGAGWPAGAGRDNVGGALPFSLRSVSVLNDLSTADFTQAADPFALFELWFDEARAAEINDPEAMTLATVDAEGLPDARMVLCKGADARGLVFYTNIESAKGRELAGQPRAAALFHWKSLRRQARFRGAVAEVTAAESDAYFASRPRGSQIGAWASRQSRTLVSRADLEAAVEAYERRFGRRRAPAGLLARIPPHASGDRVLARSAVAIARSGYVHSSNSGEPLGKAAALSVIRAARETAGCATRTRTKRPSKSQINASKIACIY